MPTVHLIIMGRVQGVYFRATAKAVAEEAGITGWVKNTEEGTVEVMATGSEEQLQKFVNWSKTGPPGASVTDVLITNTEEQSFDGFEVIRKRKLF